MGSAIKVDGNTEVMIPGVLSIKNGEIILMMFKRRFFRLLRVVRKLRRQLRVSLLLRKQLGMAFQF